MYFKPPLQVGKYCIQCVRVAPPSLTRDSLISSSPQPYDRARGRSKIQSFSSLILIHTLLSSKATLWVWVWLLRSSGSEPLLTTWVQPQGGRDSSHHESTKPSSHLQRVNIYGYDTIKFCKYMQVASSKEPSERR